MNDALERLYQRRRFGMKLGLHVEEAILARLGNPERSCKCIHVAGTNGKGSVSAMLESILRAAGFQVGLYTSPHLVRFNERIVVNGDPIRDEALSPLVEAVERAAEQVTRDAGQEPTFFECATAMAFEHFKRAGVELAVIETGMGGRLDATNIVTPLVSVITRISVEHTAYLGATLAEIAGEKAGIIKPGVPVVAGRMEPEALEVIRAFAAQQKSLLVESAENVSIKVKSAGLEGQKLRAETGSTMYGTVHLPLIGGHQVENLATVLTAVEVLRDTAGLDIGDEAVVRGLASVQWPGRFQVVRRDPPLVIDGAHNPDAARVLAEALAGVLGARPLGLIVGMCADKDVRNFFRCFSGLARRLWVTGIRNERNMPAEAILGAGREFGIKGEPAALREALARARAWAEQEDGAVCVTGSLFLVGEMLADLDGLLGEW